MFALYVEGDLTDSRQEARLKRHLVECPECQRLFQELERSQSLLKSLRQNTAGSPALTTVRRAVLSRIENGQVRLGWMVRLERALLAVFRKPRYAAAGLCVIGVAAASLSVAMRPAPLRIVRAAAVFEGGDTLVRPDGYRDWVLVGASLRTDDAGGGGLRGNHDSPHNVYIDPAAYLSYTETGEFPEGAVMILETGARLEASVKDSARFENGWGYFEFTGSGGGLRAKALPEESGCRSCHQTSDGNDPVFTQFYPVLREKG
jgi:hypothetical protein